MKKEKNPAAVALGSLGGKARAENLTSKELSEIGRIGNQARRLADTPEGRIKLAKRAARTRWKKAKKL